MHKVTCLMPTFNRVHHPSRSVEESLLCFLRQDCFEKGIDAELIIFNDCAKQKLVYDHHKVRVINVPDRSSSLSDAFNRAALASDGDLITIWTDDDIRLPWTISTSVKALESNGINKFKYEHATIGPHFYSTDNEIGSIVQSAVYQTGIFTRRLFNDLGGYDKRLNQEHDEEMDRRARQKCRSREPLLLGNEEAFLIYRWSDGHYHMSGLLPMYPGDPSQYMAQGDRAIVKGSFRLQPQWRRDYVADAADAVARLAD